MLFDQVTAARIEELWNAVSEAKGAKTNLWHESWDDPLGGLEACYANAIKTQSPEDWRSVVVQGRTLRAALDGHDGIEHRLYIEVTRLTDAVDKSMDRLAQEGRTPVVTAAQIERLIGEVQTLENAVAEDRASRKLFEVEAKRTLDEVSAKVARAKKALVHLEGVSLKPNFSLLSPGLAELAELLTTALQFIQSKELIERIKRAAEKVKEAGGTFFREVRARFVAFKLPWKTTPAEDYLTGSRPRPAIAFLIRDGDKDREERRVPGAGVAFQDCWLDRGTRICGPEMVVVPAGNFMMGTSPAEIEALSNQYKDFAEYFRREAPQRKVAIAMPFAVGRFTVTFDEWDAAQNDRDWQAITGSAARQPNAHGWGRGKQPVIDVSWYDAEAYAKWLSKKTGKSYRLLSEAEWEYVCRAGTATPFWWGSSISTEQANYDGNYTFRTGRTGEYRKKTFPVKSFPANPWGLYQVHGNVWEWCEDCWNDSYLGAPDNGSARTAVDGGFRLLRGGSWQNYPVLLRAACRNRDFSIDRNINAGFRVGRMLNLTP
jgi:formylglycine-generating enzyme required for sulfatase activity